MGDAGATEAQVWREHEAAAEAVIADCERDMQSLAMAAMVFPSHLGRLRRLAEDTAARLGVEVEAVEERVRPYEERLAELCGM